MIKKKLKIPIYFGSITVIQVDDLTKLEKEYSLKSVKGFEAVTFKKLNSKYLEIVVAFNEDVKFRTIAHEALHVLNYVFIDCGVEYDLYNDESAAYLLGWIVENIEKVIKIK